MRMATYILSLAFLSGCVTADVLRLDSEVRPPVAADSVTVLLEEPDEPYTVIGLIEVSDEGWGKSLADLAGKMKEEAGKLGGQAVIIGTQSEGAGSIIIPVGNTWMAADYEEKMMVGKVIVFRNRKP